MPFGMVVPYPAALNRVEITKGTTVLSSRLASTNPPTVTMTFPNAAGLTLSGMQTISWTGTDPDGDTLTYSLLYSRDNGATWIGVASGITGTSYQLDFLSIGGGTSARLKVLVSDGFRSAEDVCDNPFAVINKPPSAAILSPPTGMSFPSNTKLTLQGMGSDLEDGSLGDSALNWSSDRAGALGSGQILEVNLSPGTHTITPTAVDSGGLTAVATLSCSSEAVGTPSPTPTPTPTPDSVQFSSPNYNVNEGAGALNVTVTRVGNTSGTASVNYTAIDTDTFIFGCADTITNLGGAYARCDFATSVDTLTFAPGQTTKTFSIPIIDDSYAEGNETFTIVLSQMGVTKSC